ncbi:hypothetical protein [Litorivivens sp.]|uniref:hypothetical protein n=1 Tax=Litorivivens sp. TaxID=2020868 RepID=UPI00356AA1FD
MSVATVLKLKQRGFAFTPVLLIAGSVMASSVVADERNIRDSVLAEAEDVAESIGSLNQSYYYSGLRSGHGSARVGGSAFRDTVDRSAGDGIRSVVVEPAKEGAPR